MEQLLAGDEQYIFPAAQGKRQATSCIDIPFETAR